MKTEYFVTDFVSNYTIKGQALEQEYRYFKTGLIIKADNLPATKGTDFDGYSIKSARATVCSGLDIVESLKTDMAKAFIYLTREKIAYIMSPAEYIDFVNEFKTADYDSKTKQPKLRLKSESTKMLEWLKGKAKA